MFSGLIFSSSFSSFDRTDGSVSGWHVETAGRESEEIDIVYAKAFFRKEDAVQSRQ
jgi:hypothetical protein